MARKAEAMIFIMGITGAGKSYFVNQLAPGSTIESDNVVSCTQSCTIATAEIGETLVAVVDTPGFDDTYRPDEEILEEISQFLMKQYQLGIPLKGIIYLHDISDTKMRGGSMRYLDIFRKLCGNEALGNVVLATTMWSRLPNKGEGLRREQQLREGVWREMEANGSVMRQYKGSSDTAKALVVYLMGKDDIVLQIQRELVDDNKALDETTAGRIFASEADCKLRQTDQEIATLRQRYADAERRGARREQRDIDEQRQKAEEEKAKKQKNRRRLRKKPAAQSAEEIKAAKMANWKTGIQIFTSILGVTATIVFSVLGGVLGLPV